jgi:hypothetical protein
LKLVVKVVDNGNSRNIGEIHFKRGKVTLLFPDKNDACLFRNIEIGTPPKVYNPEDGGDYIEALETVFSTFPYIRISVVE